MSTSLKLNGIADTLSNVAKRLDDRDFAEPLDELERVATEVGKAWSGSWLGYHSQVYYADFSCPPPGARFSQEWGFTGSWPIEDTRGLAGEISPTKLLAG